MGHARVVVQREASLAPQIRAIKSPMKIATWNINGVRARIDTALAWVKEAQPEIVCLQEIKCEDAAFPAAAFEDQGYNVATHGQKGFNGVAHPLQAAA